MKKSLFRILGLIFCFCLLTVAGVGQTYEIEWEKSFGTEGKDRCYGIIALPDSQHFVLYGWSRPINQHDQQLTGNRTAPLLGDDDAWLVKIDADGNKIWDKAYGRNAVDRFNFIRGIKNINKKNGLRRLYGYRYQ